MKSIYPRLALLAAVVCITGIWSGAGLASAFPEEVVGPVSGTVIAGDSRGGLIVRSAPYADAGIIGTLAIGSRVTNFPRFENGWVMLKSPMNGGWIPIDSIQAVRSIATVVSVDRPEMCLRVRSGPGTHFDVAGCARMGERLRLSGFWSNSNWAEIEGPVKGWVSADQIQTPLIVATAPAPRRTIVRETVVPVPSVTYVYPQARPVYYRSYRYGYGYPYYGGRRYPYRYGGYRYGSPGVGVAVGPRGGVGVRVGGVGVAVGPRGGVGVNAGGVRVRVR